jgi:DNA polymerase I-like protein with 3'-5' exonuclease and polymerase domains
MFPDRTPAECRRIDAAYYIAFPGVKKYHNYCYERAQYAFTTNLFGIKYYGVSGHKLINMLVQGSAAFYLKLKIIELYKFSKAHNLKTKWQMQIHDELSWEHHIADDPKVFFEFKRIMEDWPDGLVPIIADMEVTTASWADKEEVNTLNELQAHLIA